MAEWEITIKIYTINLFKINVEQLHEKESLGSVDDNVPVRIQQNLYTAFEWIMSKATYKILFVLTSALWENEN